MDAISFAQRRNDARAWFARRALAAGLIVMAGDWLLRDGRPALALALFALVLATVGSLVNPARGGNRAVAACAVVAGAMPAIVDPNTLSILLLGFFLATQAWLLAHDVPSVPALARMVVSLPWIGPFRLGRDLWRLFRLTGRTHARPKTWRVLIGWIVPSGLTLVFVALFADANPILEEWLRALNPEALVNVLDPDRVAFWAFLVVAAWPLLHVVLPRTARSSRRWMPPMRDTALFGPAVILRSLVMFNLVFAVQTGLDATYLWAGHALPPGMTHATYAHRGAYPLMVSALLAGLFSLAASRHDRADGSGATEILQVLFLGQNVALVASSMRRLDLYIDAYGMTQWRLSALIWMGLVGFGLATIAVRIVARTSPGWILRTNALAALAVLYVCSVAPFADVIARSNLARCIEGRCTTIPMDWAYLGLLGPQVIPALDDAVRRATDPRITERASAMRARLSDAFRAERRGWRQWSVETWRLERYLAKQDAITSASAAE